MKKLSLKRGIIMAVLAVIMCVCAIFALVSLSGSNVNSALADGHDRHTSGWTALTNSSDTTSGYTVSTSNSVTTITISSGGSYYLNNNLTANIIVGSSSSENSIEVTLCLNGKVLTGSSGSVITVNSKATLILCDCDTTTTHNYTVNNDDKYVFCSSTCSHTTGGHYSITGGVITGGTGSTLSSSSDTTYGGGVYVYGTLTLQSGTIAGNSAGYGAGVYVVLAAHSP